jgi:hypothetical protein
MAKWWGAGSGYCFNWWTRLQAVYSMQEEIEGSVMRGRMGLASLAGRQTETVPLVVYRHCYCRYPTVYPYSIRCAARACLSMITMETGIIASRLELDSTAVCKAGMLCELNSTALWQLAG